MRFGTLALATLAVGALSAPAFAQGRVHGGAGFHAGGGGVHAGFGGHGAFGARGGTVTATRVGFGGHAGFAGGGAVYARRVGGVAYRGHDYDGGYYRRGDRDWDRGGYWGGGGWGLGGLAAGAVIGSAIAATSYDNCDYPYYGGGWGDDYGWNNSCYYGYGYAPTYAAPVTYYGAYAAPVYSSRTIYAPGYNYGYAYGPRDRYSTTYYRRDRDQRPVRRTYETREYMRHHRTIPSAGQTYGFRGSERHIYRGHHQYDRSHLAMRARFHHSPMVTGRSVAVHHASFHGHAHHVTATRGSMHGHIGTSHHYGRR